MQDLKHILSAVRPAGSAGEQKFAEWLFNKIKGLGFNPFFDDYGNLWVEDQSSSVLFTAHTDTVHARGLKAETQAVAFDAEFGVALLKNPENGYVLGADDGTGCWILLKMIEAGVKGSYVFFREEEIGGRGSSWAAEHLKSKLERYQIAVAFDRAGVSDVITHQGGTRCCSDKFAAELAKQLNLGYGFKDFKPCDGGVFTDTANLTHLIPECTNLSVGYYDQHSSQETQDLVFVSELVKRLIKVEWNKLPVERDKTEVESLWGDYYGGYYDDYDGGLSSEHVENIVKFGAEYVEELVYGDPEAAIDLILELVNG